MGEAAGCGGPLCAPGLGIQWRSRSPRLGVPLAQGSQELASSAGGAPSCDGISEPSAFEGLGAVARPATGAAARDDPGSRRLRGPCPQVSD